MDGYLKKNFDVARRIVKADWDMVFLYDGYEGTGKSVKALQDAYYCDQSFNLDRITFNPSEFKKAILAASKYQAVAYDEAYTGLSSRSTMGTINRALVSMLAEIRQKNLFVFVVMPTFFDLDKYVALWRSRALIHVYTAGQFERGYFAFYNIDKKKELYILGKKFYSYSKPRFDFNGRFTNHYVVNEKEYREKKYKALNKRQSDEQQKEIYLAAIDMMFKRLQEEDIGLIHDQKMRLIGMPPSTYYLKLRDYNEKKGI
jgi:hypothetical protein